jgi:membrane associated rhomboid family serine protease
MVKAKTTNTKSDEAKKVTNLKTKKIGVQTTIDKDFDVRLTYFLIGVCLIVAVFQSYVYFSEGIESVSVLFNTYGFSVDGFLNGQWWTPITSIFFHGSPDHLIFNMIALFFFGRATEEKLGWRKMLLIFFVAGAAGDLFMMGGGFMGVVPMAVPTIGASAAVFGLIGVSMIVDPIEMVLYPFLIPIPLILIAIVYSLYNLVGVVEIFFGGISNVAYLAHLGGLAAGGVFGFHEAGFRRAITMMAVIILIVLFVPVVLEIFSGLI